MNHSNHRNRKFTFWAYGFQFQIDDMEFDPKCDHAGCRICGAVFQTNLDRKPDKSLAEFSAAKNMRDDWRIQHQKSHSSTEHRQLLLSKRQVTPEAAQRLAAFGIIPVADMALDNETGYAMMESSPVPVFDAEGPPKSK